MSITAISLPDVTLDAGPDGRYGYEWLPRYWSEPEERFAFFVVRRHRRAGVGQRAAALLWNRFPVRWNVRVSEGTPGGLEFWARAIAAYTNNEVIESVRPGRLHPWRVFAFDGANRGR